MTAMQPVPWVLGVSMRMVRISIIRSPSKSRSSNSLPGR